MIQIEKSILAVEAISPSVEEDFVLDSGSEAHILREAVYDMLVDASRPDPPRREVILRGAGGQVL